MLNLYEEFLKLLPDSSLYIGTVMSSGSGVSTVELPGGAVVNARGVATVGSTVYVRDDAIEGAAPPMTIYEIDV